MSAEAQEVEDRLGQLAKRRDAARAMSPADAQAAFEPIDAMLLELEVPTDEWDILYRLRLQIERDLLVGAEPGTDFPGHHTNGAATSGSTGIRAGAMEARDRDGGQTDKAARPVVA
jgi:hypothetical protein